MRYLKRRRLGWSPASCRCRRRGRRRGRVAAARCEGVRRPAAARRAVVLGRPAHHLHGVFGQVELTAKPPGVAGQAVEPFDVGPLGPLRSPLDRPRPTRRSCRRRPGPRGRPAGRGCDRGTVPAGALPAPSSRIAGAGIADGRDHAGLLLVGEVAMMWCRQRGGPGGARSARARLQRPRPQPRRGSRRRAPALPPVPGCAGPDRCRAPAATARGVSPPAAGPRAPCRVAAQTAPTPSG